MTEVTLQQRLTQLDQEMAARQEELDRQLQRFQKTQSDLAAEVAQIQQQLQALSKQEAALREERADLATEHAITTHNLARNALQESHQQLLQVQTFLRQREHLEQERNDMLEANPALEADLEKYRRFAAELRRLDSEQFPVVRERVRQLYARDRERLEPLLQLQKELKARRYEHVLRLTFVASPRGAEGVGWVLPIPTGSEMQSETPQPLFANLLAIFHESIGALAPEEQFDTHGAWESFSLLRTPEFPAAAVPKVAAALEKGLDASALLPGIDIEIEVALLPPQAWLLGETTSEDTPRLPLQDRSRGWYEEEDVVSWERPLDVVEGSGWTRQGRRLRTLLIRLLARGCVNGAATAPLSLLWEPLPATHSSAMHQGLAKLLEREILLSVEGNGEVTVNPEHLDDVQNLINRDIDELWSVVIG